VFTKTDKNNQGVAWVSDGSGEFEVSDVSNLDFERGTKIVIKLRADSRQFSQENDVDTIIQKFS